MKVYMVFLPKVGSGKDKVRERKRQRYQSQLTVQHDYALLSWTARLLVIKTLYYKTASSRDGTDPSLRI